MIKIYGHVLEQEQFGDGTLKCPVITNPLDGTEIEWCYDNDAELFTLWCLVQDLRQRNSGIKITLRMPYIPHARQDRNVSDRLFTLKYFAQLINAMNFERVIVLDPHSDVSTALIDRITLMDYDVASGPYHTHNLWKTYGTADDYVTPWQFMYPDAGAAKKYGPPDGRGNPPSIIGYKHRNKEGRIDSYEMRGLLPNTQVVVIVDDICSYGGTFVSAAKELKAKGVEKVYLAVSHCENNILKGEVFDYIDEVWTTDSICTVEHPNLHVDKKFRGN